VRVLRVQGLSSLVWLTRMTWGATAKSGPVRGATCSCYLTTYARRGYDLHHTTVPCLWHSLKFKKNTFQLSLIHTTSITVLCCTLKLLGHRQWLKREHGSLCTASQDRQSDNFPTTNHQLLKITTRILLTNTPEPFLQVLITLPQIHEHALTFRQPICLLYGCFHSPS
jgi:hypothetical protein